MNRDRVPTHVIGHPSPTSPMDEALGHSKIKATALLLKQKVAGTNSKPQRVPNRVSHPFDLAPSCSASPPSPTSPSSFANGSMTLTTRRVSSSSVLSSHYNNANISPVTGARGELDIKAMILAREDPCNRNLIGNSSAAPAPAPQKRDTRAGMTRIQLSHTHQQPSLHPRDRPATQQDSPPAISTSDGSSSYNNNIGGNADREKQSSRRNAGEALAPSQFSHPSEAFHDPSSLTITTTTTTASHTPDTATPDTHNTNSIHDTQQHDDDPDRAIDHRLSASSGREPAAIETPVSKSSPKKAVVISSSSSSSSSTTAPRTQPAVVEVSSSTLVRPRSFMTARRHTMSSASSSSSLVSSPHQSIRQLNPTLRQLQTPQVPVNLVQARILQQEEQKRRDEELAKIPITANLRTVKKIQVVLVDEEEGNGTLTPSVSPPSSSEPLASTSNPKPPSRPRAMTASSGSAPVSTSKQRGDRNHVEPVMIPKKLAEQVGNILGRKLAGKGCGLDDHEEEEAVAEPLPLIVRGQPRKRSVTSSHIRNLVSSWDHKVEEAKEITSEAEQIRLFLEERSSAHAELPKFSKVPLTSAEILKALPSLPPPPSTESNTSRRTPPRRAGGRTRAASTSNSPYVSSGHGLSSSSSSSSLTSEDLRDTPILEEDSSVDAIAEPEVGKSCVDSTPKSMPAVSETTRSGKVLDNTVLINRPRRKGVRRPTATQ